MEEFALHGIKSGRASSDLALRKSGHRDMLTDMLVERAPRAS